MPGNRGIQAFELYILEQGIQYPDRWTRIQPGKHFLYYGDLPDSDDVITRKISIPPFIVDGIKLVLFGKPDPLFKIDLLGLPTDKAYQANPVLDTKEYLQGKI